MSLTRPRLSRTAPFWALVVGSVLAIAGGTYLLVSKLTTMASMLTDGTATGVEVYAGQIWAVLGAILIGVGLVGLALALTLGTLRAFAAPAAVEVVDAPAWEDDAAEVAAIDEAPAATVADAPAEVTEADATELDTEAPATR